MVADSRISKKNKESLEQNSSGFEGLVSGENIDRAYVKRNQKYVSKTLVKQDILLYRTKDGKRSKVKVKYI